MTFVTAWELLRKFWWIIPVAGLLVTVLVQRGDLADTHAKLDAATTRVKDVTAANASLSGALAAVKAMRVDNDAIATAVAAKVNGNTVRETNTRTIIEKAAANDPAVNEWGISPVPDSVRAALRADPVDAQSGRP